MTQILTHNNLVQRATKWLKKAHGGKFACGVVLSEYRCYSPEIPDVIGFNNHRSIVIECKVSRSDFKADKYKSHRHHINGGLGNYRYFLTLPNVACAEDVNNGWGLLYITDKKIIEVKESEYFASDSVKAREWSILYSIVRRLNLRGCLADIQKPLEDSQFTNINEAYKADKQKVISMRREEKEIYTGLLKDRPIIV